MTAGHLGKAGPAPDPKPTVIGGGRVPGRAPVGRDHAERPIRTS